MAVSEEDSFRIRAAAAMDKFISGGRVDSTGAVIELGRNTDPPTRAVEIAGELAGMT